MIRTELLTVLNDTFPGEEESERQDAFCSGGEPEALGVSEYYTSLSPEGAIELINLKIRIMELERAQGMYMSMIGDLRQRLSYMESLAPSLVATASYFDVQEAITSAQQITQAVFSTQFQWREREDCELPGDRYFEISVMDFGELDEISARSDEWHRRISGLAPNVRGMFRLSIDAK